MAGSGRDGNPRRAHTRPTRQPAAAVEQERTAHRRSKSGGVGPPGRRARARGLEPPSHSTPSPVSRGSSFRKLLLAALRSARTRRSGHGRTRCLGLVCLLASLFSSPARRRVRPGRNLGELARRPWCSSGQLRTPQTPLDLDDLRPGQSGTAGLAPSGRARRTLERAARHAPQRAYAPPRRPRFPSFPAAPTRLRWEDFDASCRSAACLPANDDRVVDAPFPRPIPGP